MDRFSALTVFAQVADSGSFSAAAQVLGLTPSAVSKQIAQLEDHLGARLVHRTTRKLSLTEVGEAFRFRARHVLAALEEAETAVSNLSTTPRGNLRVTMPIAFGQEHVAPVLPEFAARFPDISLEIVITDRFVDLVQEGIDVAVRIGELADSSLVVRRLAPNRRVVCASPDYIARAGCPETPTDLLHHNCLLYAEPGYQLDWTFMVDDVRVSVPIKGSVRSNSIAVLVQSALAGIGIIRLAAYQFMGALADGRLVPLLQDFTMNESEVYAVYPASRHLSPKVRAFVDYLAETIGRPGYWQAAGLE